jgi:predicted O-methyltransferase YrrM
MATKHRAGVMLAAWAILGSAAISTYAQPGRRGGGPGFGDRAPDDVALEKAPLAADSFEQQALEVLADIAANEQFRNVPQHDGRLLRILTLSMHAKHVVEVGTSTGYSGIWFGLALKQTGGKLTTYEIDAQRAATARENFADAGMSDLVTLVEGDAHAEVGKLEGPIDLVFLDADKEGYVDYLQQLLPKLRSGGLVLAHNINVRMADPAFMKAVTEDPQLETVVRGGMSISVKK